MDAKFEVGEISNKDMEIEQRIEINKFNNMTFKHQNSIINNNIFNMLSIEESIDQFLIQNTIEAEEDQILVENMELNIENGLERTIMENQFVANLDKSSKRKSLSRSSSPILRSSRIKNTKTEGDKSHE